MIALVGSALTDEAWQFLVEAWNFFRHWGTIIALAAIWYGLHRTGSRMKDILDDFGIKLDTMSQQVKAAQDSAETSQLPVTANSDTTANGSAVAGNWEIIQARWRDIRDRLELIVNGFTNKATRGKYSKIDRYSYLDLIQELLKDKRISPIRAAALINMNAMYLGLKRRTNRVTIAEVQQFQQWYESADKGLPKKPSDEGNNAST